MGPKKKNLILLLHDQRVPYLHDCICPSSSSSLPTLVLSPSLILQSIQRRNNQESITVSTVGTLKSTRVDDLSRCFFFPGWSQETNNFRGRGRQVTLLAESFMIFSPVSQSKVNVYTNLRVLKSTTYLGVKKINNEIQLFFSGYVITNQHPIINCSFFSYLIILLFRKLIFAENKPY